MKINQRALALLLSAALAGCVAAPVSAPPPPAQRAPSVRPTPAPAPGSRPASPVAAPSPKDWRDAPQTPGDWRYAATGDGSEARFVAAGGDTIVVLRCDRARRTVTVYRNGAASVAVPASITTSSQTRALSAEPVAGATPPMVAVTFAATDRLLDAMAFSRGRFVLDINGLPVLYLPAWAEIGRVVEDCRKG